MVGNSPPIKLDAVDRNIEDVDRIDASKLGVAVEVRAAVKSVVTDVPLMLSNVAGRPLIDQLGTWVSRMIRIRPYIARPASSMATTCNENLRLTAKGE